MTKDQAISELFFAFRFAKRLLQIDHPTCWCGQPSVGCSATWEITHQKTVVGLCEGHWLLIAHRGQNLWRVRWDQMEDAEQFNELED